MKTLVMSCTPILLGKENESVNVKITEFNDYTIPQQGVDSVVLYNM